MPLPSVVEIVPPALPAPAVVVVPGSKSITNRALIAAALGQGTTTLRGALWSEDTQVMVSALGHLGFTVTVQPDLDEPANRTITVTGAGGQIPRAGTPDDPLTLFVGNAGTAARFLTALCCLGQGSYRLHGVPRMHERPQGPLFEALRALGYRIDATGGTLPAVVHGQGPRPGTVSVTVDESSQFASALLLAGQVGGWEVAVSGANADELPYVEMTRSLLAAFPRQGGAFVVEPDASSGSYLWAAAALLKTEITVRDWPTSGWQVDAHFPRMLPLPPVVSRERDLGDSIMTAIVLAPFGERPTHFTDLGRLRVQECERVVALKTELTRCGAKVLETGDTLSVHPGELHGAEIPTYGDHRMAMCFATLGLVVPGLRILDPSCVRKTFPNFFVKLAALGATIVDAETRQPLSGDDLLA